MNVIENIELEQAKERQRLLVTQAKLEKEIARLEYVAMMTDVELDDGKEEGFDEE